MNNIDQLLHGPGDDVSYRMNETYKITVEPPNKGHFGDNLFVPCREVVPISGVCLF